MGDHHRAYTVGSGQPRKRPKPATTPAARRLAEQNQHDDAWLRRRAEEIRNRPPVPQQGHLPFPPIIDGPDGPQLEAEDPMLDQFLPFNGEHVLEIADFAGYAAHPSTQQKRQRKEIQWKKVLTEMFPTFMKCRTLAKSWADSTTWNHDWKPDCRCKKTTRSIDCVDILSQCITDSIPLRLTLFADFLGRLFI